MNFQRVTFGELSLFIQVLLTCLVIGMPVKWGDAAELAEPAEEFLIRTYPISDLLDASEAKAGKATERLAALVRGCIEPDTWTRKEAPASIVTSTSAAGGGVILSVRQTAQVHEKIGDLLEQLRQMQRAAASQSGLSPLPVQRPAWHDDIRKALARPTSLDFKDARLTDVVQWLREHWHIDIRLDTSTQHPALEGDRRVTFKLAGVTARTALKLLLNGLGLSWVLRDNALWIIESDWDNKDLPLRVYDVRGLVLAPPPSKPAPASPQTCQPWPVGEHDPFEELIGTITGSIVPVSGWRLDTGPGCIAGYELGVTKLLIVVHDDKVHEEIESLLASLRAARQGEKAGPPIMASQPKLSEAEQRLSRALAQPVRFDFKQKPLFEVAVTLEKLLGVPVLLDHEVRQERPSVTCAVSGIAAASALDLMLRPLDLAWSAIDGVLILGPSYRTDLVVRVYPVRDIIEFIPDGKGTQVIFDWLYDSLGCFTTSWAQWGSGPSTGMTPIMADDVFALVIAQPWRVHCQIEDLFADLRRMRKTAGANQGVAPVRLLPGEQVIRDALERKIAVDFHDKPLGDALRSLQETLQVGIHVFPDALKEAKVTLETRVNLSKSNARAEDALDALLGPLELTWEFDCQQITIDAVSRIGNCMIGRLYDVSDLVPRDDLKAFDRLANVIENVNPPASEASQDGIVFYYSANDIVALAVQKTWRMQRKVEQRLVELRQAAAGRKMAEQNKGG